MSFRAWKVAGPYGARTAWTWPRAVEMLAQDIKTFAISRGLTESAAEDQAWGAVRAYSEAREPIAMEWRGEAFSIQRAPAR